MAVAIVASQGAGANSFAATLDVSIDFGSASGRAIAVSVLGYSNALGTTPPIAITSVVVDPGGANITLTGNGPVESTPSTNYFVAYSSSQEYSLVSDTLPTGVKTVRLTMASGNSKPQMWVTTMSGAASQRGAIVDAWGLSSTPQASIGSAAGDLILGHFKQMANLADSSTVPATGGAVQQKRILSSESFLRGAVLTKAGASGSVTIAGELRNSAGTLSSDAWGVSAWSFVPTTAPDTTPPTLTSPTGTATGTTTATGTVSTNEGNGTLYRLASTNATELAATVKAAALTSAVSATGTQTVSFTGLSVGTTYYAHYVHTDASGNDSTRVTSTSFTTSSSGDTTPPVMTGTVAVTPGTTTAGALCPTASDNVAVAAYEASIDGGATWPYSSSTPTINLTGLTAGTGYTARFRARDAAGNVSTPVLVQAFTTNSSAPGTGRLVFSLPTDVFANNTGKETGLLANKPMTVFVHDANSGALIYTTTTTTDNSGRIGTISGGAMALSTLYRMDFKFSSGEYGVLYRMTEAS